jgi:hypothetical protein
MKRIGAMPKGGHRPGAGRKKGSVRVSEDQRKKRRDFSLSDNAMTVLKAMADKDKKSMSEMLEYLILNCDPKCDQSHNV